MGCCEVWWARVERADRFLHLLPPADLDRAAGFCLQADRDRCVLAAALVRLLLAARLDVGPADLVIGRITGKPELNWPRAALDFSVSHAGDQVVVAVSSGTPVGVDVEGLGRISTDLALDAARTRAWVRREAAIKAAGSGPARAEACAIADLPAEPGYLAALAMYGTGLTWTTHDGGAMLAKHAAISA
jgi:4'-phosphopantetheinyl transferase